METKAGSLGRRLGQGPLWGEDRLDQVEPWGGDKYGGRAGEGGGRHLASSVGGEAEAKRLSGT